MQEPKPRLELQPEESASLAAAYGAGWCSCIHKAIENITPKMLSDYCVRRKFKPFPAPSQDANGTRYQYLLGTEMAEVDGKLTQVNVVAGFGDFPDFPKATYDGVLESIKKIAAASKTTPDEIAEEIFDFGTEPKKE